MLFKLIQGKMIESKNSNSSNSCNCNIGTIKLV